MTCSDGMRLILNAGDIALHRRDALRSHDALTVQAQKKLAPANFCRDDHSPASATSLKVHFSRPFLEGCFSWPG